MRWSRGRNPWLLGCVEGTIWFYGSDAYLMGGLVDGMKTDLGLVPLSPRAAEHGRPIAEAEPARLYQQARRVAKADPDGDWESMKLQPAREDLVRRTIENALSSGRALTTFERFGRDVERTAYTCTGRGGFSLLMNVESQSCYSNAFLDLLTPPRTDNEAHLCACGVRALCDHLEAAGIVSCFTMTPCDDVALAAAFLRNGFRRTGCLSGHFVLGPTRSDAFLWTRRRARQLGDGTARDLAGFACAKSLPGLV